MIRYVTTNEGKVREAEEFLDVVEAVDVDYPEIQAEDIETVAAVGARAAYRTIGKPVIVDDSGLFIDQFDGFPGPYSAYVEETLGIRAVGRLARSEGATRAHFRCVIAYCDGEDFAASPDPVDRDGRRGQDIAVADRASATIDDTVDTGDVPVKLFTGQVSGTIVEPRGESGFGYDPIFEHDGRTFAELDPAEKNALSHRGRALAKFAEWFQSRRVDP